MTAPSLPRLLAANLLAAVSYLLLAKVCLTLVTAGTPASPLWLPSGLGLSLLAVVGPALLPGLLVAPQGGTYRWVDAGAVAGGTYTYRNIGSNPDCSVTTPTSHVFGGT